MNTECVFCDRIARNETEAENELAAAFPDGYPITPGHTLIVPKRHEPDYFALTTDEQTAIHDLTAVLRQRLNTDLNPSGFNIGVNVGKDAGQTIDHAHLHLIPRYTGDAEDPRGGVRWIMPGKAAYWSD